MSNYLQQAKNDFERAMGDTEADYGEYLINKAKTEALIGIGELLENLNYRLEQLENIASKLEPLEEIVGRLDTLSTDLQNINYIQEEILKQKRGG